MSPLNQQLAQDVPWLFDELGFSVITGMHYDPKVFGDLHRDLGIRKLSEQRFVKDQGANPSGPCVQADRAPTNWWGLGYILKAIHASTTGA